MATSSTRTQGHPSGLGHDRLDTVERSVPLDEAPPLAPNRDLRWVGKSVRRAGAIAKVTGAVRYTVDVRLPGMLHGRLIRSPHPHAELQSLDLSRAAAHPGVRAALPLDETVGRAVEIAVPGVAGDERERRRVLYVGDIVAALAADTPDAAEAAMALVDARYRVLPFVVDMERAREPDAPVIFRRPVRGDGYAGAVQGTAPLPLVGNVRGPNRTGSRGHVAAALEHADLVIAGEFRTRVQTHCCMETHAVVADWRADGLTVHLSTQYIAGVRRELAEAFSLPLSRVRVVSDATGGGFGSKSSAGNYVRAAVHLSRAAKAPVRIVLDRHEEHLDSGNRPATFQRLQVGAKRSGDLVAIALEAHGTAGVGVGAGVGYFAQGLYACENFEIAQYDVMTNAGPGCAMRGPGNTPGAFALEQIVDELAERADIDPIVLRDRIDPSPVRREERRIGAERVGWAQRRSPGSKEGGVRRGIGVAQSLWNAGVNTNASCEVRIYRDGSVEVLSAVQDIGTGIGTLLAQVVAEEVGVAPDAIVLRLGDSALPSGPPSYGSMTTASLTPAARNAAWRAMRQVRAMAAEAFGTAPEQVAAIGGRLATLDGARSMSLREATALLPTEYVAALASRSEDYGGFASRFHDAGSARVSLGGVQFAAVAVDTETGVIRVERVVAVQDCGRPINPKQIESQVQGGVMMGLSYALYEARVLDRRSGHVLNADLEHYKIARAFEVPEIEVVLLEHYRGTSATDAYGVAEPANIATAPAIANAVYNAIGIRLRELPMTPAVVLAALGRVDAAPLRS